MAVGSSCKCQFMIILSLRCSNAVTLYRSSATRHAIKARSSITFFLASRLSCIEVACPKCSRSFCSAKAWQKLFDVQCRSTAAVELPHRDAEAVIPSNVLIITHSASKSSELIFTCHNKRPNFYASPAILVAASPCFACSFTLLSVSTRCLSLSFRRLLTGV